MSDRGEKSSVTELTEEMSDKSSKTERMSELSSKTKEMSESSSKTEEMSETSWVTEEMSETSWVTEEMSDTSSRTDVMNEDDFNRVMLPAPASPQATADAFNSQPDVVSLVRSPLSPMGGAAAAHDTQPHNSSRPDSPIDVAHASRVAPPNTAAPPGVDLSPRSIIGRAIGIRIARPGPPRKRPDPKLKYYRKAANARYTQKEDELILLWLFCRRLPDTTNDFTWKEMAEERAVLGRTAKSLKSRWNDVIKPDLRNYGVNKEEEDRLLRNPGWERPYRNPKGSQQGGR